MIIFGTRLFGKVDAVPGLGHVATRFFHVDYLPLIPVGSYLVFAKTGKTFRGIPIPLSFKSLAIAWVRVGSVVAGMLGVVWLINAVGNDTSDRVVRIAGSVVVTAVGWGLFAFSMTHRLATKAGYARACRLGVLAKLNPAGMTALARAYGEAPPTFGFEPIPIPQPVVLDELEVIPVDGEDGEEEPAETVAPTAATAVRPIRPKSGY